MAIAKTRVESGEVISASLMNYILEQLEKIQGGTPTDLEDIKRRLQALETWRTGVDSQVGKVNGIDARLSVAETSLNNLSSLIGVAGKVRISGFDPPTQLPVGQVLTILGTGFKPTLVENLVFINDTPIYNFRLDSDSSRLKIVIPLPIPGVTPTPGGTTVNIRVSNNDGEATQPFKVTPAVTTTGAAPKITTVVDVNNGQVTGPILHTGHTGRVTGEGLGADQNFAQPVIRFIYKTPTGPVSYVATLLFTTITLTEFTVPDIREAPTTGTFDAIMEISRSNFVPALAQVTMTRIP